MKTNSWIDGSVMPEPITEKPKYRDSFSYRVKRKLLGNPLNRHALGHQKLSNLYALGILSSDCISSSAYGSEQILLVLLPAFGLAGYSLLMPMTGVIIAILVIVTFSYRQVVSVYTKTGGSYVVTRDNFGVEVAQVAAVALMLDYIVTVAVQTSAGTAALISAFPSLGNFNLLITLFVIGVLFYGNLRGVKEAGKLFAAPAYLFIGSVGFVIIKGIFQYFEGNLHKVVLGPGTIEFGNSQGLLNLAATFMLMRALANGGSSLTGLEAISNGVSLFKSPEGNNARKVTVIMSAILGSLVVGVSLLAVLTKAVPYISGTPTVIAQIAQTVLGQGLFGHIFFLLVQFSTMLILYTGANTPFTGFPFLANFIAEDGFLPKQLTKRGHRLVFSNGIFFLTLTSAALVIVVGPHVDKLVAFYAIGVFTGFTLAGFGMAKRSKRLLGDKWRINYAINAASGAISALIVVIFAVVKFNEGAWLIVVIFPLSVFALLRLHKQYVREEEVLTLSSSKSRTGLVARHEIYVLVNSVDLATLETVRYAKSLNPHSIKAVHFVLDDQIASTIENKWSTNSFLVDVPIVMIDCPDRRLEKSVVDLANVVTNHGEVEATFLFPRRSYSMIAGRILHDQTADKLSAALSNIPFVVATIVPFDVKGLLNKNFEDVTVAAQVHSSRPKTKARTVEELVNLPQYDPDTVRDIDSVIWRRKSTVEGEIVSITSSSSASAPIMTVEVWDKTGGINLEFLGRRTIGGLNVGSRIRATGMVADSDGVLVIRNPKFELRLNQE